MFAVIAGLVILALVLVGVVWRPRGLPVFVFALVGAIFALLLGLVGLPMLLVIVGRVWDAAFTLIGLFILSAALERNNFFEWAATSLAHIAKGTPWRLYLLLCVLTILVTIFLGNDGAILGMTAIVAKLVKQVFPNDQEFPREGALPREKNGIWWPYLFATGFLTDAFSAFLVPDNLTNIIVASTYHLPFVEFMLRMALPMIIAAIVVMSCFALRFRSVLFGHQAVYNTANLKHTNEVLEDRLVFKISLVGLLILIAGHLIIGGIFHQPVSFVVVPVAILILAVTRLRISPVSVRDVIRTAPWEVLIYALGMFVVITAAMTPTVIQLFLSIGPLRDLVEGQKSILGLFVTGGLLGVLSAVTNNLPATLAGVLILQAVQHPAPLSIYAMILGVDIGPKLTPYGSLATLLWLGILKREGIEISWGRFFKENWWVAALALTAALGGLLFVPW